MMDIKCAINGRLAFSGICGHIKVNCNSLCGAPDEFECRHKRCITCNGEGDVHSIDGEWIGYCHCEDGQALENSPPRRAISKG